MMVFDGFGNSRMLQNTNRIHSNQFWNHLASPNIKNSTFYNFVDFPDFQKLGVASNHSASGVLFSLQKTCFLFFLENGETSILYENSYSLKFF